MWSMMRRILDSFHRFAEILFAADATTFAELDGFFDTVDNIFEIGFEANVTMEKKESYCILSFFSQIVNLVA